MDSERLLDDHAMLVRAGRIEWIGPASEAPAAGSAAVVDGAGAFAIPGLIDMHVHVRDRDELDLYLLNGITTVVNLAGYPELLPMRDAIAAGELRGPAIHTAGPIIDGDPAGSSSFVPAGDAAAARRAIAEQEAAGYDFVKIYDRIEREAYDAAIAEASARGLAVAGHIPKPIGLEGILGGHDLVVHAEEYFYTFFANRDDAERIPAAVRLSAGAGLALCPNTGFIHAIIEQAEDLPSVLARPEVRYLPPAARRAWLPETNRYRGRPPEWLARNKRMYPFLLELTKAMHEGGVPIVAGTDASTPGAVPGFSLIAEILDLERAGLSRFEALRAATATAGAWIGRHLHVDGAPGVLAAGRGADMTLLAENPLADLEALKSVRAVVARGVWHDHAALLRDVEERAAAYDLAMEPYHRFTRLVAEGRFDELQGAIASDPADLVDERLVNAIGYYHLAQRHDAATAVAVFAANAAAHPRSSNAWDSLGEGCMEAGDQPRAMEAYRRSLEIDPGNGNAEEMIERMLSGAER